MSPVISLTLLLRLLAVAEFAAAAGIVMPAALMARLAPLLGAGAFPDGALAPYLARCLSAMYVMHGGFAWVTARDVAAYRPFVTYLGWSGIAFSALITWLDIQAGFRWFWWVAEGPGLTALSVALLVLARAVSRGATPGWRG
jgi:hypothetical protein